MVCTSLVLGGALRLLFGGAAITEQHNVSGILTDYIILPKNVIEFKVDYYNIKTRHLYK